jgi:hypothetical protein
VRLTTAVVVLSILCVCSSSTVQAQIPILNNTNATPVPGSDRDYIKMLSETVDPANGSVSIRLSVPTRPGRGPTFHFSFAYDSSGAVYPASNTQPIHIGWDYAGEYSSVIPFKGPGWSYTIPTLATSTIQKTESTPKGEEICTYYQGFVATDSSGAVHSFPNGRSVGSPGYCPNKLAGSAVVQMAWIRLRSLRIRVSWSRIPTER